MSSQQPTAGVPDADRYRRLLVASRTLAATLSPAELHAAVYRETSSAVEAPGFFLALHDEGRALIRLVYLADEGRGLHVDVPTRGSESEVLAKVSPSIVQEGGAGDVVLRMGRNGTPAQSAIVAPLVHRGHALGAIGAQSQDPGAYDQTDLDMLEGLADVTALAIYNSQQFAELERRRKEAEQLEEIGRALTSKLDPDQVLGLVISAVSEVLDVDGTAVWLSDPRDRSAYRVADSGGDMALPHGLQWDLSSSMQSTLIDAWAPVVVDDLSVPDVLPEDLVSHLGTGSVVGVPLVLGGQVEGMLTAGSRKVRRFSPDDIAVLQRLASQASVAMGNARLHATLHALSLTDPLTGLPNRRRLQIHLDHEVSAARRGRPLAIAVFDIDKFKHYNDTFGHIAGDEILRAIGHVLSQENRAMNVVARYGGDEFVSVLSETGIDGARHFVERVHAAVREDETLSKFGISISIGCAEFDPETMASVNDILRAADADMYEVKVRRSREKSGEA